MPDATNAPDPVTILVDADACPVKEEIYRVAELQWPRHLSLAIIRGGGYRAAHGAEHLCPPGLRGHGMEIPISR